FEEGSAEWRSSPTCATRFLGEDAGSVHIRRYGRDRGRCQGASSVRRGAGRYFAEPSLTAFGSAARADAALDDRAARDAAVLPAWAKKTLEQAEPDHDDA